MGGEDEDVRITRDNFKQKMNCGEFFIFLYKGATLATWGKMHTHVHSRGKEPKKIIKKRRAGACVGGVGTPRVYLVFLI